LQLYSFRGYAIIVGAAAVGFSQIPHISDKAKRASMSGQIATVGCGAFAFGFLREGGRSEEARLDPAHPFLAASISSIN
jgi:hypothetical protein